VNSVLHMFHLRSLSPEEGSSARGSGMCSSGTQKSSQEYIRDSTTNKVTEVEVRLQRGRVDGEQEPGQHLRAETQTQATKAAGSNGQRGRKQSRAPWRRRSRFCEVAAAGSVGQEGEGIAGTSTPPRSSAVRREGEEEEGTGPTQLLSPSPLGPFSVSMVP